MKTVTQTDIDRMIYIEGRIEQVLLEFRSNTEALLVMFALVRLARRLLRLYNADTRNQLAKPLSQYLTVEALDSDENNPLLYAPGGGRLN